MVKNLPANAGDARDASLIPGFRRSTGGRPGGGHGNPVEYSCLENPWTEEHGGLWSIGSHNCSNLGHIYMLALHREFLAENYKQGLF